LRVGRPFHFHARQAGACVHHGKALHGVRPRLDRVLLALSAALAVQENPVPLRIQLRFVPGHIEGFSSFPRGQLNSPYIPEYLGDLVRELHARRSNEAQHVLVSAHLLMFDVLDAERPAKTAGSACF
jgi:hypothetical protein